MVGGFMGIGTPEEIVSTILDKGVKDITMIVDDTAFVNTGVGPSGILPQGAMFDSSISFSLIRGGHIDLAVLGGLQVDAKGNLANWMVPGQMVPGMGGAMDLVIGAKRVIIAMEHTVKNGDFRILEECTLPLTGEKCVDMIVTELAVFSVTDEGLVLEELQEGVDLETVRAKTGAAFKVSPNIQ